MTRLSHLSIHARLLLLLMAIILPFGGLLAWYLVSEEQEAKEVAYERVKVLADITAANLSLILRDNEDVMSQLAQRPLVRSMDARHCDPMVGDFVSMMPEFNALGVRDTKGQAICSYIRGDVPMRPVSVAQLPWFQESLASQKFSASDAFLGHTIGRWVTVLTYPLQDVSGTRNGLLSMPMDLHKLNQRVMGAVPKSAVVVVIDRKDQILLRSIDPANWIGKALPPGPSNAIRGLREGFLTTRGADGIDHMYALVRVPGTDWRVAAGISEADALATYRTIRQQTLLILSLIVLVVLALAWRIAAAIVNPVRVLAELSGQVANGDTHARAPVAGPVEIKAVAEQFNRMLEARAQVEAALRDSEARWKFALEGSGDGVWDLNVVAGTLIYSKRWKEMLGYAEDDIGPRSDDWSRLIHPTELSAVVADIEAHLEGRTPSYVKEHRVRCHDGSYKWVLDRGLVVSRDEHGKALRMVGTQTDITDHKCIEEMLTQRRTELQVLYASLQTIREEERRRFARELHDDLGHRLTVLNIDLDWLEARLPDTSPAIQTRLATIKMEVDQIVDAVRRISEDLRPGMLDNLGMDAAIENYVNKFSVRTGIPCELRISHENFPIDDHVATGIFRLLQEALNNALKHAKATRIEISVQCREDAITLLVHDDGVGLPDDSAEGEGGFGLPGMRERVAILKGRFNLTSAPGQGVKIEVEIPL